MVDSTTDPTAQRLLQAGLNTGGIPTASSASGAEQTTVVRYEDNNTNPTNDRNTVPDASTVSSADKKDWRVRIHLPPGQTTLYNQLGAGSPAAEMMKNADGVIFPYTPQMTVQFNARYSEQSLTHSNYKGYFYEGSDISPINLSGVFTAQNEKEALYVQAAIYFLRTMTKMRFGSDPKAGTPPQIVRLSGYGDFYMPDVNCVITSFSHTMPDDCDYIPFKLGDSLGRIPSISTIQVTLQPVVSRGRQAGQFNLEDFSAGKYIANGGRSSTAGGLI